MFFPKYPLLSEFPRLKKGKCDLIRFYVHQKNQLRLEILPDRSILKAK